MTGARNAVESCGTRRVTVKCIDGPLEKLVEPRL